MKKKSSRSNWKIEAESSISSTFFFLFFILGASTVQDAVDASSCSLSLSFLSLFPLSLSLSLSLSSLSLSLHDRGAIYKQRNGHPKKEERREGGGEKITSAITKQQL